MKTLLLSLMFLSVCGTSVAQHEGHTMPPATQSAKPTASIAQTAPEKSTPEVERLRAELLQLQQSFEAERQRGRKLAMEDFSRMAENLPSVREAMAASGAARGELWQASRWSNPVVGYTGEKIRGGKLGGGNHGFFVAQDIPLGGRLRSQKDLARATVSLAEADLEVQRAVARNRLQLAFYALHYDEQMLQARWKMAELAVENFATAVRLRNLGQLDLSEVLQAGIEAQRAKLAYLQQQDLLRADWATAASYLGEGSLPLGTLRSGAVEEVAPELDESMLLSQLLQNSSTVQAARANVARAESAVTAARRALTPDLRLRAGLQQSRELTDELANKRVGLQGLAEVGLQIPLFNRNQGAVQAAVARVEVARAEQQRAEMQLRQRFAQVAAAHRTAKITAATYKNEILPSAELSYKMMRERWGQMTASYPLLLSTQRSLAEAQAEYLKALRDLKRSSIELQGPLADEGLMLPLTGGDRD